MAWQGAQEEIDAALAKVDQLENAVSQQTSEMWMRSKLIFYTIFATTAARYLTIHNEISFISGSLMLLFLFYYLRNVARDLPYKAVGGLLFQLADMAVALFQIFLATSIGNTASSFITGDGTLSARSVNKIFILIMMIFVCMLVLPKHFHMPTPVH